VQARYAVGWDAARVGRHQHIRGRPGILLRKIETLENLLAESDEVVAFDSDAVGIIHRRLLLAGDAGGQLASLSS
jgi:hypothetical protein